MLRDIAFQGAADQSLVVRFADSGDGTPETGVTSATGGLDIWYRRPGAAKVSLTESDLSALTDAHSDGGMLHIADGSYRVDFPDAAYASAADYFDYGAGATGMVGFGGRVKLMSVTRGLAGTALPAAAADAAGGLVVSDAGGFNIDGFELRMRGTIVAQGTIGAGNDATHLNLGLGHADDVLNQSVGTLCDVDTGLYYTFWITDSDNGTGIATVAGLPVTFVPQASTDQFWIGASVAEAPASAPTSTTNAETLLGYLVGLAEYDADSVGLIIQTLIARIDAAVTSRMATFTLPANFAAQLITAAGKMTVGTNDDKTGYALTAGERTTLAGVLEAAILDEGDATALLAAIAAKVEEFLINEGDAAATLLAMATAVRTELAAELALIDVATSTRASQTSVDDIPTTAEFEARTLVAANYAAVGSEMTLADGAITAAKIAASALNGKGDWNIGKTAYELSATGVTAIHQRQLLDAYAAHGVLPTLEQAIMWLQQHLDDSSISGVTKTVKKVDGTTAGTLTLNSATTPTSITRAT